MLYENVAGAFGPPAAVERVPRGDFLAAPQQVAHGRSAEPLAVHAPLARGLDQPVRAEHLQHVRPVRALARVRDQRPPETVQAELVPQPAERPARAPLPRAAQGEPAQQHAHAVLAVRPGPAQIRRKKRHLARLAGALVEHADATLP